VKGGYQKGGFSRHGEETKRRIEGGAKEPFLDLKFLRKGKKIFVTTSDRLVETF